MGFRVEDETPAEEIENQKRRNAERLNGHEAIPMFAGFMMASMAGGNGPAKAAGQADLAMAELRKRYT